MRQPSLPYYCNSLPTCKHICLTVITLPMLLFVGCTATPTRTEPPQAKATATQNNDASAINTLKPTTPPESKPAATEINTQTLFDGKSLTGWSVTDFAGHGNVTIEDGTIILGEGVMTGVTWTNPAPEMNYEISLEAMRVDGSDFFCGLTFPVGDKPCSLIVGGWGGGVVGLSSLDGEDAANNETTKFHEFQKRRWYGVKVRVEPSRIQAWIDAEKLVDVITTDRKISIRPEVELSRPLGIASWSTRAALRNIRVRKL